MTAAVIVQACTSLAPATFVYVDFCVCLYSSIGKYKHTGFEATCANVKRGTKLSASSPAVDGVHSHHMITAIAGSVHC